MKQIKSLYLLYILMLSFVLSSCEIDQVIDPNNPSTDLVENATEAEIQNLLTGIESGMRNGLNTYFSVVGPIGREYYRFSDSDPRFVSELLGQENVILSPSAFYLTIPFSERYRVVKNANLLIEALEKTSADISTDQKNYLIAVAKTYQAHELLMVLNMLYNNGIRTDVKDPDNLGPFRNLSESLSHIKALLDEAATALEAGTEDTFSFALSAGFAAFSTPTTFRQFNRALSARVAVYQQNWDEALSSLDESFFTLSNDLTSGAFHFFSTSGGDLPNPIFYPPNTTGELLAVHPSHIADAEVGDTRIANQASLRNNPVTDAELTGEYDLNVYKSQSSPISIIRNAELILIYAEAKIQKNELVDAVTALNIIRNAAGLANYSGVEDQANLINEMLRQRRYELFAEGHRWIDMRRYRRLSELPLDRVGDDVWEQFPIPLTEGGL